MGFLDSLFGQPATNWKCFKCNYKSNIVKENQLEQQFNDICAKYFDAIGESFTIPICSQCNDNTFNMLKFNSIYTGMQIQCKSCDKKIWLTSDINDSNNLKKLHESYKYLDSQTEGESSISFTAPPQETAPDSTNTRKTIPKLVKQEVWQRDNGQCVECGSKEKLEYDHIIPVSKGGANTVRNIQLLCENCNRTKSSKIQ